MSQAATAPLPRPAAAGVAWGSRRETACFIALALALLAATMHWHIPMMLWDHLDLVPLQEGWKAGTVRARDLLDVHHGSHVHAPAYAVLLVTTELSGGRPWLDCLVSWAVLVAYAGVFLHIAARPLQGAGGMRWRLALVFFALFPGHLANLQWGWQVAVFLSLAGTAGAILALTRGPLDWALNLLALAAACLAAMSFSTGLAVVPVAVLLVAMRAEIPASKRMGLVAPWLVLGLVLALHLQPASVDGRAEWPGLLEVSPYALNFLGAGVARFATDASPVLALAALATGAPLAWRLRHDRAAWPWAGWMAFAVLAALLVGFGRVAAYGGDQAFVSRYVSVSSTFWLGWFGLVAVWLHAARPWRARGETLLGALAAVFVASALFNAVHLAKKAHAVSARAGDTAREVRETWPAVREGLLREIYFDRPDDARQRLEALHAAGASPFAPED